MSKQSRSSETLVVHAGSRATTVFYNGGPKAVLVTVRLVVVGEGTLTCGVLDGAGKLQQQVNTEDRCVARQPVGALQPLQVTGAPGVVEILSIADLGT